MNKNLDLRVQKTYSCLMNAMLKLLKEKDFEEITVNELCERALVGRGTFYKCGLPRKLTLNQKAVY